MAERKRSSREIEDDLRRERDALQGTLDALFRRLTFEGAWETAGSYMRTRRGDLGPRLGQMMKEKPLAVALTAVGVGWLLFGPSARPPERAGAPERAGRDLPRGHEATRARLERAAFDAEGASGPSGPGAQPDAWTAPRRYADRPDGPERSRPAAGTGTRAETAEAGPETPAETRSRTGPGHGATPAEPAAAVVPPGAAGPRIGDTLESDRGAAGDSGPRR